MNAIATFWNLLVGFLIGVILLPLIIVGTCVLFVLAQLYRFGTSLINKISPTGVQTVQFMFWGFTAFLILGIFCAQIWIKQQNDQNQAKLDSEYAAAAEKARIAQEKSLNAQIRLHTQDTPESLRHEAYQQGYIQKVTPK